MRTTTALVLAAGVLACPSPAPAGRVGQNVSVELRLDDGRAISLYPAAGQNRVYAEAVKGADCVMLCAPVGAFAALAERIAPHLEPGAVLTDVGSTKQSVIRDIGPLVPAGVHFVPAHPVAGTEYSGPDAGFTTLFEGRWTLLTPPPGTDEESVEKVAELWRRCGSMVERM